MRCAGRPQYAQSLFCRARRCRPSPGAVPAAAQPAPRSPRCPCRSARPRCPQQRSPRRITGAPRRPAVPVDAARTEIVRVAVRLVSPPPKMRSNIRAGPLRAFPAAVPQPGECRAPRSRSWRRRANCSGCQQPPIGRRRTRPSTARPRRCPPGSGRREPGTGHVDEACGQLLVQLMEASSGRRRPSSRVEAARSHLADEMSMTSRTGRHRGDGVVDAARPSHTVSPSGGAGGTGSTSEG